MGISFIVFIQYLFTLNWKPPITESESIILKMFTNIGIVFVILGILNIFKVFDMIIKKNSKKWSEEYWLLLKNSENITIKTENHVIRKENGKIIIQQPNRIFIIGLIFLVSVLISIFYVLYPVIDAYYSNIHIGLDLFIEGIVPFLLFAFFIFFMFTFIFYILLINFTLSIDTIVQEIEIKRRKIKYLLILQKKYSSVKLPLQNLETMEIQRSEINIPNFETIKKKEVNILVISSHLWTGDETLFSKVNFNKDSRKIKILTDYDESWMVKLQAFLLNYAKINVF